MASKKWMFKETPSTYYNSSGSYISNGTFSIAFISNNTNFTSITFYNGGWKYVKYNNTQVFHRDLYPGATDTDPHWLDESYRTITLSEEPTGDFLLYLQTNAIEITVPETPFKWGGKQ